MKNFVSQVLSIMGKYDSTWEKYQEIHFKTLLERKSEEKESWSINFFAGKGLDPTNGFFSYDYTLKFETLGCFRWQISWRKQTYYLSALVEQTSNFKSQITCYLSSVWHSQWKNKAKPMWHRSMHSI